MAVRSLNARRVTRCLHLLSKLCKGQVARHPNSAYWSWNSLDADGQFQLLALHGDDLVACGRVLRCGAAVVLRTVNSSNWRAGPPGARPTRQSWTPEARTLIVCAFM